MCDGGVDDSVAKVVCRQLGLSLHGKTIHAIVYAYLHGLEGNSACA